MLKDEGPVVSLPSPLTSPVWEAEKVGQRPRLLAAINGAGSLFVNKGLGQLLAFCFTGRCEPLSFAGLYLKSFASVRNKSEVKSSMLCHTGVPHRF